ncbi:MAG: outer membrane lipoprotein carrier protein LolA [Paludibacteraceae bacterium]|nr:outer membrane lipoprotein carrier protein LolA [Paludibacteraceae bacterium]
MKKTVFLLLSLVCAVAACAQKTLSESEKAAFLQRLKTVSATATSIESRFVETRHVEALQSDVKASGRFYYAAPDKMALHYDDPAGDLLCVNGEDLLMVNGGRRMQTNVRQNPSARGLQRLLLACMRGDIAAMGFGRKTGQITAVETDDHYQLTLVWENSASNPYRSVVLCYQKADLSLISLRMNEKNGNFAVYMFSGTRTGQPVDAARFDIRH